MIAQDAGVRVFPFEDEPTRALEYMPLDFRRALDIAGVRLPLAAWQVASVEEKRALMDRSVETDEQVDAFRQAVLVLANRADAGATTSATLAPEARVWTSRQACACVAARARQLGEPWDDALWDTLDESERYVLYRLSRPEKSEAKFKAALDAFIRDD